MIKLNPSDYDYLWTDYDVNFLFVSCYLFREFRKSDMLLTYDHSDKGLRFYLSKTCRKRMSDYGMNFYRKTFPRWKKEVIRNIEAGENLVRQTNKQRKIVRSMTTAEIRKSIIERVNLFQSLGGNYFHTEFFFG